MSYRLNQTGRSSVDVLRCEPNLNAHQMVMLKNRLRRLISRNHRFFLLDMKKTSHVDVAGISILVDRIQKIRSVKGDVRFLNLRPQVRDALSSLGVSDLIESYDDENEAVKSFKGR